MRRLPLILFLFAATLSGCRRELAPAPYEQGQEMGIYVSCPGPLATRAEQGETPASVEEYKVHSLQVWIFRNDTHQPLYQLTLLNEDELPAPGQTRRYAIPVESEFARTNPLPTIDVFALANGASVGSTLNENSSWEDLNSAFFSSDDWFGVGEPVRTINPTLGLPMTGTRRDMTLSLSEDGFVLNATHAVEIIRAVSKIRYVFCRLTDSEDPTGEKVSIQNITLNGSQIPLQEYLFTEDKPYRIGSEYESRSIPTDGPDYIAQNDAPEKLVYAGQNATSYEQLLDDAISDGILTDGGVMYLRESDKALSGSITFTTDGEQRTRVFAMAAPGDFVRNHSWTLYGYFISGRKLELSINAIPWEYNRHYIDFSQGTLIAGPFIVDGATANIRETSPDHYDVLFKPGTAALGRCTITAPINGRLMINPVGDASAFIIEPDIAEINPNVNGGEITISIRPNPSFPVGEEEYSITLSFLVETIDGQVIGADSELNRSIYRFVR